jgi:hypothetical protein
MKVLFLDIDGVLNSVKTSVAFGGYPLDITESKAFDWVAIKLLQRMCDSSGVQIVLSSTWRTFFTVKEMAAALELPIIDATPVRLSGCRGLEIQEWLDENPGIEKYCIIDDDPDMLESQKPYFVQTNAFEGMTWEDFTRVCKILDVSPYEGEPRDRNWRCIKRIIDEEGNGWMS